MTTDSYDANGNTTSSGGHTYGYDFENRLVSKDGSAVTVVYDGDGNRIAKTAGGVTTKYLVDDLNPTGYLQVMDEVSGGAVQVRYTFGDMLVSQTRNPGTSPSTSFYGYDAHRNITFLTDASGSVTDTYDYDAWGNLVAITGSTPNTRLYEGQEVDPDLDLINLRARQYRASTGRFLTLDPLRGELLKPTSLNKYLFSDADPVNLWDPKGKQEVLEFLGGLALGTQLVNAITLSVTYDFSRSAGAAGNTVLATAAQNYLDQGLLLSALSPLLPVGGPFAVGGTIQCALGQIAQRDLEDAADEPVPATDPRLAACNFKYR